MVVISRVIDLGIGSLREGSTMAKETKVQSQVITPVTQKWYLIPSCLTLSIIKYESRVSGATKRKELHPLQRFGVVAKMEPLVHPQLQ